MLSVLRLTAICAGIGMLAFGLWPFHAPKNEVRWSGRAPGLIFGSYGSIISSGSFVVTPKSGTSSSLEIWLEPRRIDSGGTILSFYRPESHVTGFRVRQFVDGLELQRGGPAGSEGTTAHFDQVFTQQKPILLSISSGEYGTVVYKDGVMIGSSRDLKFSSQDLAGQLIVGNTPGAVNDWSGQLKGLAIYDRELKAAEVGNGLASWITGGPWNSAKNNEVIARYLFAEGKGNTVHNQMNSSTDLIIPERYFVIQEPMLEAPWHDFHSRWSYWLDVGINIAGFVPFGLILYAYFYAAGARQAGWLALAFGFSLSITIEVLQAFLPTRDSGWNDVITNTIGTALGANLCSWITNRSWVRENFRLRYSDVPQPSITSSGPGGRGLDLEASKSEL